MNALDLARLQLQQNRLLRSQAQAEKAEVEDSRSTFAVPFVGYRKGVALGQMPGGGLIPIEPGSNGGLTEGQVVIASAGRAGRAIGRWMPR